MMKNLRVVTLGLFVLSAGCGSGGWGSSPTAPVPAAPAPPAAVDLSGAWGESTGGDVTWQLSQTGTTVSGTGRFSKSSRRPTYQRLSCGRFAGTGVRNQCVRG